MRYDPSIERVPSSRRRLLRFVFSNQPRWVSVLMRIRDAWVAGFGLKTAKDLVAPGKPVAAAHVER
jgi:hypothetical protein